MSAPRWVLIPKAAELLGYSRTAIEHKVKNGVWSQGRIWRKARDGRIFINIEEVDKWVESAPQEVA
ncbi:excisionase [Stutzerimonas stutzeri]|uniref:excisionase n=1 Tax=Pseudomonadaceae TaxID=135621 RepID=UPI000F83E737|nr:MULTISPECIES: excisionase [Pseudomonadaceae]EMC3957069.1 excisionase [Pseudomonas aeruginosa]MDH0445088.1 excisionase [Stutzerimonas stutzeri]RTV09118.1 excisionase [Pseudomonas aeruginosa]